MNIYIQPGGQLDPHSLKLSHHADHASSNRPSPIATTETRAHTQTPVCRLAGCALGISGMGTPPIITQGYGQAQPVNERYIYTRYVYMNSRCFTRCRKGTPLPRKECMFLPLNATEQGKVSNQGFPGHPKGKLAVPMAPVPANRSNTDRYSSGTPHACICDKS